MKKIDLTGQQFGRLTVIKEAKKEKGKPVAWLCKCACGREKVINGNSLRQGKSQSCGSCNRLNNRKHGKRNSRIYNIWRAMKNRCLNKNYCQYYLYGGRGITVCEEWRDDFQKFYDWAIANGYRDDLTLDRIDTNGNYEPSNCRWATYKEQNNNTRANHLITYNGETHTMAEWAEITGISYNALAKRLNESRWPVEKALTQPAGK